MLLRETIRPTRLAFLLAQPDRSMLADAIETCTALWGGIYDPIVVLDQSARVRVGNHERFADPYDKEILGLLKDFDVDLVVTLGTAELPAFLRPTFGHRHIVREGLYHEAWRPGPQPAEPRQASTFLEAWPFIEQFWYEELRGVPQEENRLRVVSEGDRENADLLAAAQFGRYRREGPVRYLRDRLGAREVVYDAAFRSEFESGRSIFPIDLTALSLSTLGQAAFIDTTLFLLDHEDIFDVVDYWNLRAAGMMVFPLPVARYQEFAKGVKAFVLAAHREPPRVAEMPRIEVMKARSVSDERLEEATNWVREQTEVRLSRRHWYLRFGMDFDPFVTRDITPVRVEASSGTIVVVMDDSWGHVLGHTPPCEFHGDARQQQWTSELLVFSGGDEHMYQLPWLNADCDALANHHVGLGHGAQAGRVGRHGLVDHRLGDDRKTHIRAIPVFDVVKALMKNAGFEVLNLSSNGLAAERIVAQLGGIHACSLFQHRGVCEVLHYLERGERSLPAAEILARLRRLNRPTPYRPRDMDAVMDALVSKGVLRPGLIFQCTSCGRRDWYHVSKFDERFQCRWCFTEQRCPRLETARWHYRTDGLFALEGRMGGSLSVLLAILHLKQQTSTTVQYSLSFEYATDDGTREVDFLCFVKEGFRDDVEIVVGEAKTGNDLTEVDITRMDELGARLDAWVLFCTLAPGFSDSDKEHFRRLRTAGRRLILLDGGHLEMFIDELLHSHNQPGYTLHGGTLKTLSVATTESVIGAEREQP